MGLARSASTRVTIFGSERERASTGDRRCAPFLIVSLGLRINPPNKSFDVCLDKWCHSLENGNKFGTNLADLANMLSLIHRNLYRGLMCAIWAEVLCWFTNREPRWHSNRVQALSLPSSQDS